MIQERGSTDGGDEGGGPKAGFASFLAWGGREEGGGGGEGGSIAGSTSFPV